MCGIKSVVHEAMVQLTNKVEIPFIPVIPCS